MTRHLYLILIVVLLGLTRALPAGGQFPKADEVRDLQTAYRAERDTLVNSGADKRFLPGLLAQAEAVASRADVALKGGRLLQAAEGYRQARWQLPYSPPGVPAHTARVFGNLRLRHTGAVNAVAFSPDGKHLATACADRTVKVWDLANGHEQLAYREHAENVRCVAFSPDGKLIASAGGKDVRLWEPLTGKDVQTLAGKGRYVTAIAFSPDGKFLAAAGNDNALRIYDTDTGEPRREIGDFGQMVLSVAFSPEGRALAAGSGNGQVRLFEYPKVTNKDLNQPEYWARQDDHASHFVVFSPDGRLLVRIGPDALKIYNVQLPEAKTVESEPIRTLKHPQAETKGKDDKAQWFTCAAFSKDGRTLYTGGQDSVIRLWDVGTGASAGSFKGHNEEINALALNASGNTLASASADFTVRLWHFDVVSQSRDYAGHAGAVWSASFSADGQRLVSAGADRALKVWDVASGKPVRSIVAHPSSVTVAALSPDGKTAVTGGGDRLLKLWDAESGKLLRTLEGHQGTVTAAEFSPDGNKLVSGATDRRVKVWDAGSGKELLSLDADNAIVTAAAFSPDGKRVAAATVDRMVRVWDAGSGNPLRSWAAHNGAVTGLAFSPNGQKLATCGADQLVRVWDLDAPDGQPLTIGGHGGPLSSVAFRRDGQYIASAGSDRVVKLWRLEAGGAKEAQAFRGHRDWVTSVAFSKDGFYVVSASVDRLVKVWEVTSKELPLQSEHTGAVLAVAVSPDGKLVASGGTDRTVKLWNPATGEEVRALHGHAKDVLALAFAPDGKTIISTGEDSSVRLWDPATGRELPRTEEQKLNLENLIKPCPLVQVTPDGKRMLAWVPGNERYTALTVFDLPGGKELLSFNDAGRNVTTVAFGGDGKRAAVGATDGTVRVYDMETKQPQPGGDWAVFAKGVGVTCLAYGGAVLAAGGENGEVKICDPEKRAVRHTVQGHDQRVSCCAVSADGKRVATAGGDGVVKLWDVESGKELRAWDLRPSGQERGGFVARLAFTPDGRHLLTANANTTLYMLENP